LLDEAPVLFPPSEKDPALPTGLIQARSHKVSPSEQSPPLVRRPARLSYCLNRSEWTQQQSREVAAATERVLAQRCVSLAGHPLADPAWRDGSVGAK